MNIIWKKVTLMVILFIALINSAFAIKKIDPIVFTNSFVNIRGNKLVFDTLKTEAYILIISPFCSQCVHQIISELKYNKDSVKINFLNFQNNLSDNYSKRSSIDFLNDNYESNAFIYFFDDKNIINKNFEVKINATPDLFLKIKGRVYYLSHNEMFPKGKFYYKSIREYFK